MKRMLATIVVFAVGIAAFLPMDFGTTVHAHSSVESKFSPTNSYSPVQANSLFESNLSLFGDTCRNVKFKFRNYHSSHDRIQVKKVEYFNRANGRWQSEVLRPSEGGYINFICDYNAICTTRGDDLRDAEGEDITQVRFIYRFNRNGWSDDVTSRIFEPTDPACYANRSYGNGQAWTIGEER